MDYLKETLEHITTKKLVCQNIFNFLNEINPTNSPEDAYTEFETIWKDKLIEKHHNFLLSYNSGLWLPTIPGPQILSNQLPWSEFLLKHFSKYISTASGCPKTNQPLNFQELLNLEFWNHLYNLYGSPVVLFILTKCLVVFLVQDQFYLLIANPDSLLHKYVTDYTKSFGLRRWKDGQTVSTAKSHQSKSNSIEQNFGNQYECAVSDAKSALWQEDNQITMSTTGNPGRNINSSRQGKRKRVCNNDDLKTCSPMKRSKACVETKAVISATNCKSLKRKRCLDTLTSPIMKRSRITNKESEVKTHVPVEPNPKSTTPFRRWIAPKAAMLQKICDHRLSMKKEISKSSGKSIDSHNTPHPNGTSSSEELHPTFVNIVDDKYFKQKENNIAKQLILLQIKNNEVVLEKRLEGLRVPESLLKDSSTGAFKPSIMICIYTMCEKLAKQLDIRIKPRKRSKKTRQHKNAKIGVEQNSSTSTSEPKPAMQAPDIMQNNLVIQKWLPFSDTLPVLTGTILYDKKTGCKFEPTSSFGNILSQSGDISFKAKDLLQQILGTKVHESRALNHRETKYLQNQIKSILNDEILDEKLCPILKTMITFHTRVKNVTQLVRCCVLHWIDKQKEHKTRQSKFKQKKSVVLTNPSKLNLEKNKTENQIPNLVIEEIDLTSNTPSTTYPSDGSSNSHIPSEQQYKCTNSSSFHSITPSDPAQPGTGSGSSHEKSAHNLSVTMLQSPPCKTIKKHKEILKKKLKEQMDLLPSHILSTISQLLVLSGGTELLGSKYNQKQFLKFIRKAVFMSGLNSALHLGELLGAMKPSHCKWLSGLSDMNMKNHIFSKSTLWLLTQYIFPILKLGFYITETNASRFQACFFLKDCWKSLSDRIIGRYFKEKKLNPTQASSYCRLRFIPKKDNLRPILSDGTHKLLTLTQQENILQLLHYLNSRICPHATIDSCVLRVKWKQFLQEWRQLGCPKLYYVRADIKDAFPSVNIEKLCVILKELVEEYQMGEWTVKNYFVLDKNRSRVKKSLLHDNTWNASINNWPAIVMDNGNAGTIFQVSKVLDHLIKILQSKSTVTIKNKRFVFSNGLPQGSFFSHLLCNIYYGYMERELFHSHLNVQGEFFVRSVDDYFYVSPKPNHVNEVFHKLKKGVPDSNCYINHAKSMTNIYVTSNQIVTTNIWVPFCGWRFCITNGHISRNFETYAGQDICSTLTFRMTKYKSPIEFIDKRMGMITALRLTPIVLDPDINCQRRIIITLFEGSLMMAFRFYAICRVIFTSLNFISDPIVARKLAKGIIHFARSLSKKVNNHKSLFYPPTGEPICTYAQLVTMTQPQSSIEANEVHFLAYHAFLLKLNLHYEVFKTNLIPIVRKIKKQKALVLGTAITEYLLSIVGNKLPEHFQAIKI